VVKRTPNSRSDTPGTDPPDSSERRSSPGEQLPSGSATLSEPVPANVKRESALVPRVTPTTINLEETTRASSLPVAMLTDSERPTPEVRMDLSSARPIPSLAGLATIAPPQNRVEGNPGGVAKETLRRGVLTVLGGPNAGQVFSLDREEMTIGRGIEADIWIEDPGVSRRHAVIRRAAGDFFIDDLGSTNGTFVHDQEAKAIRLVSGDRIQVGPNLLVTFALVDDAEEELRHRLYDASTRDGLTRAYNRQFFLERLSTEMLQSAKSGAHLAVLILDLDHFKRLNDTYGHLTGDMVLRSTAAEISRQLRPEDVLSRYGGEEFVVLCKGLNRSQARDFAEKVRQAIALLCLELDGFVIRVTASIGIASLDELPSSTTRDDLLKLADDRLYEAKSLNRNCVVGAEDTKRRSMPNKG
jgi:two-component system, cell cycle response regulator